MPKGTPARHIRFVRPVLFLRHQRLVRQEGHCLTAGGQLGRKGKSGEGNGRSARENPPGLSRHPEQGPAVSAMDPAQGDIAEHLLSGRPFQANLVQLLGRGDWQDALNSESLVAVSRKPPVPGVDPSR